MLKSSPLAFWAEVSVALGKEDLLNGIGLEEFEGWLLCTSQESLSMSWFLLDFCLDGRSWDGICNKTLYLVLVLHSNRVFPWDKWWVLRMKLYSQGYHGQLCRLPTVQLGGSWFFYVNGIGLGSAHPVQLYAGIRDTQTVLQKTAFNIQSIPVPHCRATLRVISRRFIILFHHISF